MKAVHVWKRLGVLIFAFLMLLSLFTGCTAEEVDFALDLADSVLEASLAEEEPSAPSTTAPTEENSQAPPDEAPSSDTTETAPEETPSSDEKENIPDEDGRYTSPEDVAWYLHCYGKLPCNFISKKDAKALGWDSSKGNLWDVTEEMSIGGDRFGNYEGALPEAEGRTWKECDVNYFGGYRGSERLLYSNDGLIFYTDDHYKSFTQLY